MSAIDAMQASQGSGGCGSLAAHVPNLETMKSQLQALQLEDPARVFIARRINKLGFTSADKLRHYFTRFGDVKNVHVSHSRVKSSLDPVNQRRPNISWRLRAAALGFVVMASSEAAAQIIAEGPEHEVNGVVIRVQPFHRRSTSADKGSDPELFQEGDEECGEEPGPHDGRAGARGQALMQGGGRCGGDHGNHLVNMPDGFAYNRFPYGAQGQQVASTDFPEGHASSTETFPDALAACSGFLFVSEQDLQDAMPSQYED